MTLEALTMAPGTPRIRPEDTKRWAPFRFINDSGYPVAVMDSVQTRVAEMTTDLIYHAMRKP